MIGIDDIKDKIPNEMTQDSIERAWETWKVRLTTISSAGGMDWAKFGADENATTGFDISWDEPEPPTPPFSPIIQAYFYYQGYPVPALNVSYINTSVSMTWQLTLYVDIRDVNNQTNITLTWNANDIENVPSEYYLTFHTSNENINMREAYNCTFSATTGYYDFNITAVIDVIPPEISNVSDYPDPQIADDYVNISCNVTDEFGVDTVKVNITGPPGFTPVNATMSGGSYYNTTYNVIGTYYYFIWANDTNSNTNTSATYTFTIREIILPEITDNTPTIGYTGDPFTFNATVTDNHQVSTVWVEYWYELGFYIDASMTNVAGDYWEHTININETFTMLQYIISANDTSNNWNYTGVHNVTIYDTVIPEITDVQAIPSIQNIGDYVNISASVIDNIGVDEVYLYIEYPDGIVKNIIVKQNDSKSIATKRGYIENFSITQNKTGDTYYCNKTYQQPGIYTYHIWANDTSGNINISGNYYFRINNPPYPPSSPSPPDGATNVSVSADLSWTGGDPDPSDTVTYDVYFGTSSPPQKVASNQTGTTYDILTINYSTTYYWQIVAWDNHGASATGPIWEFTTEEEPEPDLDCVGTLSWTDVSPGSTVTGSFTVENIGEPTSLLDWEITEWPEWGSGSSWTFTPLSGDDLTPEDGPVTVNVLVVAPDVQNSDFSGEVKIENKENSSDFCTIPVSLSTPVSQPAGSSSQPLEFLQGFIQQFPVLEQILLSSLLYRMFNLQ